MLGLKLIYVSKRGPKKYKYSDDQIRATKVFARIIVIRSTLEKHVYGNNDNSCLHQSRINCKHQRFLSPELIVSSRARFSHKLSKN